MHREVFQLLFAKVEGGSYRVFNFVVFDTDGSIKGLDEGGKSITLVENFEPGKWYEISATFENLEYQAGRYECDIYRDAGGRSAYHKADLFKSCTQREVRALFVQQYGAADKSGKFLIDYAGMYENLKPIVITNPIKGTTYYADDTVDLNFTINGLVSSADVYVDGNLAGAANGVCSYQLTGLGAGTHAIMVKAVSLAGEEAESDPVEITMEDGLVIPSMFQNDMMLQRRQNVNVWGSGPNGETATVTAGTASASVTVENSEWKVVLPPMEAGGSYDMIITEQAASRTLRLPCADSGSRPTQKQWKMERMHTRVGL